MTVDRRMSPSQQLHSSGEDTVEPVQTADANGLLSPRNTPEIEQSPFPPPIPQLIPRDPQIVSDGTREVAHFLRTSGPSPWAEEQTSASTSPEPQEFTFASRQNDRKRQRKKPNLKKLKVPPSFTAKGPALSPRFTSGGIAYIEILPPSGNADARVNDTSATDRPKLRKARKHPKSLRGTFRLSSFLKLANMTAASPQEPSQLSFSGYDPTLSNEAISTYMSSLQLPDYAEYTTKEPPPYQPPPPPSQTSVSQIDPAVNEPLLSLEQAQDPRMAELRFDFERAPLALQPFPVTTSLNNSAPEKPLPSIPGTQLEMLSAHQDRPSTAPNYGHRAEPHTFATEASLKAHYRLNASIKSTHGPSHSTEMDLFPMPARSLEDASRWSQNTRPSLPSKVSVTAQPTLAERERKARDRKLRDLQRLRSSIDDIIQIPSEHESSGTSAIDASPGNSPDKTSSGITADSAQNQGVAEHLRAPARARESASMPCMIKKIDTSPLPLLNERFPAPAETKPTARKHSVSSLRFTATNPLSPPPSRPVPALPPEAHEHQQTFAYSLLTRRAIGSGVERLSLKDRLEHSQRENRLLAAALEAVLRTNGRLNGCTRCLDGDTSATVAGATPAGSKSAQRFSSSSSASNPCSKQHSRQPSDEAASTWFDATRDESLPAIKPAASDDARPRRSQDTSTSSLSNASARTASSSNRALDAYIRTRFELGTPGLPTVQLNGIVGDTTGDTVAGSAANTTTNTVSGAQANAFAAATHAAS